MEKEIQTAEVDWKSESQDVVYAVREVFHYPELLQKNFDELAENYAAEPTENFIDAFGQELSTLHLLLYEIAEDSDSYALTIIPAEDEKAFRKSLTRQKKKGVLKKQPGRKLGSRAKRIDLANRLSCEKFSLAKGYSMDPLTNSFDDTLWLRYMQFDGERRFDSAFLSIAFWPPVQGSDLGLCLERIAKNEDGTYVAIAQDNTLNEQGYLLDHRKKVLIGKDIHTIKNWRCVYEGDQFSLSDMVWFKNGLFVADKDSVYHIKDPDRFSDSMEKVLELTGGNSRLFVLGNTLYLYLHHTIYKWEKSLKQDFQFSELYRLKGCKAGGMIPVGDHKVVFQIRPEYISGGVTETELTVLDINTLQTETYPCHHGFVVKWTENRICVLPTDEASSMPIIECFDTERGEKRCLMYGALGKERVLAIYETKCGTILRNQHSLYRVNDLWNDMKA